MRVFRKFTQDDVNYLLQNYKQSSSITSLSRDFAREFKFKYTDSLRRSISKKLETLQVTNKQGSIEASKEFRQAQGRKLKKSNYYFITWEQNETPLHLNFWENILAYKEFLDAELSVVLGRYKVHTDVKHENWNKVTEPYHDASRHDIHKFLRVLSDVKINPTRKYPLTGLQGLAHNKSIVLGHPKIHLRSEPTLSSYPKRMLFTTGAITLPNYTDSGIGAISEGNHKFGFVIVEVKDDEIFFIRQVEADKEGNFIDLCHEVRDQKVIKINKALGLVCGDSHYGVLNLDIDKQNDILCDNMSIDRLVLHDAIDGESCNNHLIKSPLQQYKRYREDKHLIEKELDSFGDWLSTKLKYNPVLPISNHHTRFDRILEQDWRIDIPNSLFYLKYTQATLEGKAPKGVLPFYLEDRFGEKVTCLDYQDSYVVGKYECSLHGDFGANGSRGTPVAFRHLNIPMILAHSHTPWRADDTLYVGTNTYQDLGYNRKGASSWQPSNVLIAKNGIAQHIIFVKKQFTTFFK